MKKVLIGFFFFFLILSGVSYATDDYYVVTGTGQFLDTTLPSYPTQLTPWQDEYMTGATGMTVERFSAAASTTKPNYPAKTQSIENSDGTLLFMASGSYVFSIFTVSDGTLRCHLNQGASSPAMNYFTWHSSIPNVGYLFYVGSMDSRYTANPSKFYKVTINTSTWAVRYVLLDTLTLDKFQSCPSGESIHLLGIHDEGPTSWDGRYWLISQRCTKDTSENNSYALYLVGDIESVPKSDIGGQADMGMRTDRCLKFPA